jgi:gliding motility-associated-like protein
MVKVYQTLIFCVVFFIVYQTSQAQKLYFSDNGDVKRMNLDGTAVQDIVAGTPYGFNYIAVDGYSNLLFYNNGQETYSSRLDGTSQAQITNDGAFAGYANIAVIPDYEVLIYVGISDDMDDLWRGSYYDDPSTPPTFLTTGITMAGDEEYLDVAYNASEEKIYFTGYDGAIYSAYQDGSGATMIVGSNAYGPVGVDYANGKVYWVQYNAGTYSIWSANLNGSAAVSLLSNGSTSIESLDVYPEQNAVFFAQTNGIYRMALNGVGGKNLIYTGTYISNVAIDFDIVPPAFFALSPTDGATNVTTTSNLVLTFNENVKKSATVGTVDELSFRIYETTGNVLVETIDRSSSTVSVSGNTVTINPTTTLNYNTDYYVLAGNKTISDFTDNNWIGIVLPTAWNFKTELDPNIYYSRQNGNWNSTSTWSHAGHTGPPATSTPGTGTDVIIGNAHTVTLTGNTGVVGNTAVGTWIMSGATLDAASYDLNVWGTLRIDGTLSNPGILSGMFDLYASGSIPIFEEIHYGVTGLPGSASDIFTHVVALNGIQSIDGGTINTNGFQICVPPTPPPTLPIFSNVSSSSLTLSWTAGGGQAFVVAREGSTSFKPQFGQAYTANATFGTGDEIGTDNFLVYSGSGNTVTITGLTAGTSYEFDLYSYSTSIGGCYSIQNYQFAAATSCILLSAPTGAVNAQYCTGDTKPSLNVNSPGTGKRIRWYDAPTGGNIAPGNDTGGDGLGGVFIPSAPSGTFYAETYDETLLCASPTRTAVTLTLHPPLVAGSPSAAVNVCSGGDPGVIDGGTASGGTGTFTYQWESATAAAGPYTALVGETAATFDPPSGITQTTYYRRITRSATCLQTGSTVTVNVTTAPAIAAQPATQQVCEGMPASFSVTATGSSLEYQWQSDPGTGFVNISNGGVYSGVATSVLQIANATGLNNVRYQCVITSGGVCPVISSAVPLVVSPRPAVVNQTQAACENAQGSGVATVDLTSLNSSISGGASGITVAWFTNAALTTPVATPSSTTATNNAIFYAKVTNSTGCSNSATATITISDRPIGTGTVTGATSLCVNGESTYAISGITNAQRYQWQVTPGLEIVSQTGANVTIRAISGSTGTITAIGENNCGTGGSANLTVQILPGPDFEIVTPEEVITGEPAEFSYQTSSGSFSSVRWDFGDNATSTEDSPVHQYSAEGDYTVSLTAVNDLGCENTKSTTINVLPVRELADTDIKNVITANGDEQNGFLYIENIEKYPSNQVVLLDRWGVEVFKKDNYLNDWDARKHGEFLPAGQYVCVVKLNETGKVLTRTVSVIKRK